MVHEDRVVAAIAEQRAAELPDLVRCLHPAGGCGVELTKLLEALVLVHREEGRHPWQLPCPPRCSSACAPSVRLALGDRNRRFDVLWTLRRAIHKDVFTRRLIDTNDIRFAAGLLHLFERPELGIVRLDSCQYAVPLEPGMTLHVPRSEPSGF